MPYVGVGLVAVSLLLVSACSPQRKGPKHISSPVYDALEKATATVARANEYRDAGILLYEPRFLEAEKAVDEVSRQVHDSQLTGTDALTEVQVSTICYRCVSALKWYRLANEHLGYIDNPPLHPDARYKTELAKAVQGVQDAGKAIGSCIKDADSYLR